MVHLLPDEFLHLMDFGVVGDFVGEVSASASSLWLGSVSDSSLTDTSEPGRNKELSYHHHWTSVHCSHILTLLDFPKV